MFSLSRGRVPFAPSCLFYLCSFLGRFLENHSHPPGATVELDGVAAGATPFEKNFPGGYFHRTHTALGQRLGHPMVARVSLSGYSTHEIALTEGPMDWIDLHGRHHGQYWLFKTDHFHVDLETIASTFMGAISAATPAQPAAFQPELSLEELVRRTKPAVVCLKGFDAMGSGFFVTETGVIATNAHVARGDSTLVALLPGGAQLQANVVYIDPDLDIALAKGWLLRPLLSSLISRSPTPLSSIRANPFSQLGILAMPCCSALPRGLSAPLAAIPRQGPELGFKPMRKSIPETPAARCSTFVGK